MSRYLYQCKVGKSKCKFYYDLAVKYGYRTKYGCEDFEVIILGDNGCIAADNKVSGQWGQEVTEKELVDFIVTGKEPAKKLLTFKEIPDNAHFARRDNDYTFKKVPALLGQQIVEIVAGTGSLSQNETKNASPNLRVPESILDNFLYFIR